MTRIAKTAAIALAALTAIIAATLGIAILAGAVTIHTQGSAPATVSTGTVSTFNDGYATAMQDSCQQGSTYACAWLRSN